LSPGRSLPNEQGLGSGRWGLLEPPRALAELAEQVKALLKIERLQLVGEPQQPVRALAVGCGAAGEFLDAARRLGCDAMLLGETSFHTCLEAESRSIGLILPGHFASERFAVECLADVLHVEFPSLEIWPSRRERDPLRWV